MGSLLDTHTSRIAQLDKLKELQTQERNLKVLQGELERINLKIKSKHMEVIALHNDLDRFTHHVAMGLNQCDTFAVL